MIIFVFLITVIVVFLVQWWMKREKFYAFARDIPCARNYGILGHGPHFLGKDDIERFNLLHQMCLQFTQIIKLWLGPNILWIFVNDPKLIQKVLLSPVCLEKPFFYKFLRLDAGLISSKYETWKVHRKSLNYSFNMKILQSFIPIFIENAQKLCSDLSENLGKKQQFDMLTYTSHSALNMICGTSFGVDIKNITFGDEVFHALEKLNKAICARSQSFFLYSEPIYRMSKYYRDEMASRKVCYSSADILIKLKRRELELEDSHSYLTENMINEMREEEIYKETVEAFPELANLSAEEVSIHMKTIMKSRKERAEASNSNNNDDITPNRKIFIDHVICNDTKFTNEEVRDHVYTIVAAGSETTALQTAHTIMLLATHPEIQERVAEEIKEVFYSDDVEISVDNLLKLTYLEMCIKESLRLCPVVPVIGRETQAPVQIGEFEIPSGITLLVNFYSLHRRPDIWGEDAEKFNPDHFLPENVDKRPPYSFLPFSGGQRNCIGYRYAMIALKILLLHLIKQYRFKTEYKYEDLKFRTDINLKLVTKHLCSVESRH